MQINEDFWGGADKTETYVADIKRTTYLLRDALNSGDIPLNEYLDISISPWAINKKADLLNICYGFSHRVGDSGYVHATPKFYPIHDLDRELNGVPFYFMNPKWTGNAGARFDWYSRNGFSQSQIVTTGEEYPAYNNYRSEIKIIRDFDYSKFVYMVRIYYATNAYTGQTMSNADFNAYASWDYSYFFQTDEWLNNHPIIGIRLTPYYKGADSNYPDKYRNIDIYMNSLGYQKPMTEIETNAETGYNIPFIDNFMTLVYNGYNGEGLSIGMRSGSNDTGLISIQDNLSGIPVFDSSYEQNANWILSPTKNSHMIPHSATYENAPFSKWVTTSVWNGSSDVLCRSELRRSAFSSTAEMQEYVFKQIAYLGTWFTFRADIENLTENTGESDKWFLGEIDENGVTTGNYKQGTATSDYANSAWHNPWDDSPYNGRPDDPNQYSDTTNWNDLFAGTADFTKVYILDSLDVVTLHSKFYEVLPSSGDYVPSEIFEETFLTSNPTDVIMSLRYYNCDLEGILNPQGNTASLYLGSYNTGINVGVGKTTTKKFSYGSCTYYPHFHDFRDYEPYSYAELVIPYCGTLKISPADFMGHELSIDMVVDFATGACTAFVLKDKLVIDTLSGQMGIDIPVTAAASADYQRDLFNNSQALKQAKTQASQSIVGGLLSIGSSIMSGNPFSAANAISNTIFGTEKADIAVESAEYNLEHTRINFKQVGAATPAINAKAEQKARLIIYRPIMGDFDPQTYGRINGFATVTSDNLSNYSGYTKCAAVKADGIPCSAVEKNQIIKLLQAGVYL